MTEETNGISVGAPEYHGIFPTIVLKNILDFLPLTDLATAAVACRKWFHSSAPLLQAKVMPIDTTIHRLVEGMIEPDTLSCGAIRLALRLLGEKREFEEINHEVFKRIAKMGADRIESRLDGVLKVGFSMNLERFRYDRETVFGDLICSVRYPNLNLKLFLDRGASVVGYGEGSITPIHKAAISGAKYIRQIAKHPEFDPNIQGDLKSTPLHWASRRGGSKEAVELLLQLGARADVYDKRGKSPLIQALEHTPEAVKPLLRAGAKANGRGVCGANRGLTPLMMAISYKRYDMIEMLVVDGCADVNAFFFSALKHKWTVLDFLLRRERSSNDPLSPAGKAATYLRSVGAKTGEELP